MTGVINFLAFTPRGVGLMCALFYIVVDEHVYGWYTGSEAGEFPANFFMLENFYSTHATMFYRTHESDVYGDWFANFPPIEQKLDRPVPVPEQMCHELERAQSVFAEEWLLYRDAPGAAQQLAAYAERELPVQSVNIKLDKLNKLDARDAVWTYTSPGIDLNVIDFLCVDWQLDYKRS
jgi:hypothetical protein